MSGPNFQLTPPLSNWKTGYQPPNFFGDRFKLKLNTNWYYASSQLGWSALTRNGQVVNIGPRLPFGPSSVDCSLLDVCGDISRTHDAVTNFDPNLLAKTFQDNADSWIWDALRDVFGDLGKDTWTDIGSNRKNVVKDDPASRGKINPSGTPVQDPDDIIAGIALPSPPISIGKRFPFASHPDVHVYLNVDKDATQKPNYLLSGVGVGFEGKTSDGTPLKLRLGAGRDEAGGGAGFFILQFGPDPTPMPSTP